MSSITKFYGIFFMLYRFSNYYGEPFWLYGDDVCSFFDWFVDFLLFVTLVLVVGSKYRFEDDCIMLGPGASILWMIFRFMFEKQKVPDIELHYCGILLIRKIEAWIERLCWWWILVVFLRRLAYLSMGLVRLLYRRWEGSKDKLKV